MHKNMCVYFNWIIWLMVVKMRLKIENRSQRYDINRPMPRHGQKYTNIYVSLQLTVIWIKQHLSNILSSIHENVKQNWGWKKALLIQKELCIKIWL